MPQTQILLFRSRPGVVPVFSWLDALCDDEPRAYIKCLERIRSLSQLGNELRFPSTKMLEDGIWSLRTKVGTVNYRIFYFFCSSNVVCLSHGITKEDEIDDYEIKMALDRKELVESDLSRYTAVFQVEE